MRIPLSIAVLGLMLSCTRAHAAQIVVHVSKVASATATAETPKALPVTGHVDGDRITFDNLTPGVAYSVQLKHADGAIDQGFNANWYSTEPAKEDPGELTDDDRQQINTILKSVLSFFNRNEMITLIGNHDRAVALVQLIRDKKFHSDSGDEIIWRVELWYLKKQHGGWEKIQQTDKTLRRERFATSAEFHAAVDKLKWVAELGGLVIPKGQDVLEVTAK